MASGGKRVLIAAAADTGLLATVARAGSGLDPDITVVDRCETPLELCRRYASERSLPVQTQIADLTALDLADFDVVYMQRGHREASDDCKAAITAVVSSKK